MVHILDNLNANNELMYTHIHLQMCDLILQHTTISVTLTNHGVVGDLGTGAVYLCGRFLFQTNLLPLKMAVIERCEADDNGTHKT